MIFKGDIISGREISGSTIKTPIGWKSLKKFKYTHCKPGAEFEMSLQGSFYPSVTCRFIGFSEIDCSPMFDAKLGGCTLSDYMDDENNITMKKRDIEFSETVEMTLTNIRLVSELEILPWYSFNFVEAEKKPTKVIHKFNLYEGFEL